MKHPVILTLISITTAHAASAASALVAGWDFSNVADISNNTLSANHCDWIRSTNKFGVGDGSAYGMLYFNGEYGSSNPLGHIQGSTNNLTENQNIERYDSWYREMVDPDYIGTLAPFNTLPTGQTDPNPKSLLMGGSETAITFKINNCPAFKSISFAASVDSTPLSIKVELSSDGTFDPADQGDNRYRRFDYDLTLAEQTVTIDMITNSISIDDGITMRITGSALGTFYLDNVAFNGLLIPEPATYALLFGGAVLALAVLRRKRT